MRFRTSLLVPAVVGLAVACADTPTAQPTPDIDATVEARVQAAVPTPTPSPTPDIRATVEAGVQATAEGEPTATATPTLTSTSTPPPSFQPTATPTPTLSDAPLPVDEFLAMPTEHFAHRVEGCREALRQMDEGGWQAKGQAFASEALGPPDIWSPSTRESARALSQVLMKGFRTCGTGPTFNELFGALFTEEYRQQRDMADISWQKAWNYTNNASEQLRFTLGKADESPFSQRSQFAYFQENWSLFQLNLSASNREIRFAPGSQ